MQAKCTQPIAASQVKISDDEKKSVDMQILSVFTPENIDELRRVTNYNPRQRIATAQRIILTVVEGFLGGDTLSFEALRAIFVRRFEPIGAGAFQKRFKQDTAPDIFLSALKLLVY